MGTPYVGEIRMFAGSFAPVGWMFCQGQQLRIDEHEVLFMLIDTKYGGDGQTWFHLPDLRGRLPVHQGNGFPLAQAGGTEEVTLTVQQTPVHGHRLTANGSQGSTPNPGGQVLAGSPNLDVWLEDAGTQPMSPQTLAPAGGSQPHTNLQPYLCVDFIISLFGIFPSQT